MSGPENVAVVTSQQSQLNLTCDTATTTRNMDDMALQNIISKNHIIEELLTPRFASNMCLAYRFISEGLQTNLPEPLHRHRLQ